MNAAIAEAISLAKAYGYQEDISFINGVWAIMLVTMQRILEQNSMREFLGLDTSNYTTSCAIFDAENGTVRQAKNFCL